MWQITYHPEFTDEETETWRVKQLTKGYVSTDASIQRQVSVFLKPQT
jgi:hypothetical protein